MTSTDSTGTAGSADGRVSRVTAAAPAVEWVLPPEDLTFLDGLCGQVAAPWTLPVQQIHTAALPVLQAALRVAYLRGMQKALEAMLAHRVRIGPETRPARTRARKRSTEPVEPGGPVEGGQGQVGHTEGKQ